MKKRSVSALGIIGAIYAVIGSIFSLIGGAFLFWGDGTDLPLIGTVFTLVGSIFLILGCVFLVIRRSRSRCQAALVENGRFIWAQVCDITVNRSIEVNGRHPVVFIARYSEGGREHLFRSGNIRHYRDERLLGRQVRIYVPENGYEPYYMDVEELLPEVTEH